MTSSTRPDPAAARLWLAILAATLLSVGAAIVDPNPATAIVLVATLVAVGLVLVPDRSVGRLPFGRGSILRLIGVALLITWITGLIGAPVLEPWFLAAFTLAMGLALAAVAVRPSVVLALGAIAVHLALAVLMVATLPPPANQDVDLFPRDASAALARGENPYAITFPNIYGPGTPLYAPEVQVGDRLDVGYPYPPLSLLLAATGELVAGDHRYVAITAVGVAAVLLMLCGSGRISTGAALLLVSSPLTYRVVYNGWSEPLLVPFVAGTVLASLRAPRIAPVLLGLTAAGKQYAALLLISGVGLLAKTRREVGGMRMLVVSLLVAAATILPFFLWDPGAFLRSVVEFHLLQPLRPEAVSIPGLLLRGDVAMMPAWVGFAAGAVVLVAVVRWAPRTASGFALGSAAVYLVFFIFSKQAFMNYYFFVLALLLAGVAAAQPMRQPRDR